MRTAWGVFTDLESMLDNGRADRAEVRATVARLQRAGVPVVPISAKTFEEVEPIARELGLTDPLIVEAGAAIARRRDDQWELETCGPDADSILDVVGKIEVATGAHLSLYSVMRRDEAARLSGLALELVPRSQRRLCDEPFVISRGELEDVVVAAGGLGFSVRHDGRLYHLCGAEGTGAAFMRVREELGCALAVGIGSSAIDGDYLSRCDVAVIVPRDARPDPELLEQVPQARIAADSGVVGWVATIEKIRSELFAPAPPVHASLLPLEHAVS